MQAVEVTVVTGATILLMLALLLSVRDRAHRKTGRAVRVPLFAPLFSKPIPLPILLMWLGAGVFVVVWLLSTQH